MIVRSDQSQATTSASISRELLMELVAECLRVQRSIPHYGPPTGFVTADYPTAMPGIIPAIVLTSIGQCSGDVPGTGTVQLYYLGDGEGSTAATANPDDGASVTVYNWYLNSGTIAVGTHCFVGVFSGVYWLIGAC